MKIAIHKSGDFVAHWVAYCQENAIPYKLVSCYDNDILRQLDDCDVLMWHHNHASCKDVLFAKQFLFAIEQSGKKVFPDFMTSWHFDDKVGQKYLFEAIHAPLVPSYIFYSKKEALQWVESASFPKVFKLRRGAASQNVKLVKTKQKARKLIKKSFNKGFAQYEKLDNIKERWRKYRIGKTTLFNVLKGFMRIFYTTDFARIIGNEKGYVYFQDYIPNNTTDYRVKIVNGRCWAFQRKVRPNDFRASGSGALIFDRRAIPMEMIYAAYGIYNKLKLQSVAFDFVMNGDVPLVIEMSYCFGLSNEEFTHGYWDSGLTRHEEVFNPFEWMIENLIHDDAQ